MSKNRFKKQRKTNTSQGDSAYDSLYQDFYTDPNELFLSSADEQVLLTAKMESDFISENTYKKMFNFRKRSKMPFKLRVLLFSLIFGLLFLMFIMSFCLGTSYGVWSLDLTNSFMSNAINAVCDFISQYTSWDGRIALERLFCFGCVSYIIISSLVSFVITGIIALFYSYHATWHAFDDGTNNFAPEK